MRSCVCAANFSEVLLADTTVNVGLETRARQCLGVKEVYNGILGVSERKKERETVRER